MCLSCTGTGERVCLSAEGFGNRQCFLESIVDKVSGNGGWGNIKVWGNIRILVDNLPFKAVLSILRGFGANFFF